MYYKIIKFFKKIYLDDVKVGAKIEKDILKATMPLKPNRNYKLNVQALSSKSDQYADSTLSNSLHLSTSLVNNLVTGALSTTTTTTSTVKTNGGMNSTLELLASRGSGGGGGVLSGQLDPELVSRFNLTQVMSLTKFYEQENEREFGVTDALIPLRFTKITEDYVDVDWSKWTGSGGSGGVNEYKIQWHCLNTNEHFEHRCSPNMSTYRIKRLRAGFTYCIRVFAIKNTNTVVNRSRNFIVQMSAPPDAPLLKLR